MAKKTAKKVGKKKPKPKLKQKQKQKQSQKTSVTVNINTEKKRKAPRATNGNTNRVLQQFAQPIITLPSNLINPPPMPQYGLNPSQLQTRRNDYGLNMGQRLGSDSELRERMRAGVDARPNDEQSLSGFSIPFSLDRSDSLRNYQEPSVTSGISPSLGSSFTFGDSIPSSFTQPSNFTMDTSDKSSSVALPPPPPIAPPIASRRGRRPRIPPLSQGRENISFYSMGGLITDPPVAGGVPMPDNVPLRPPDDRYRDTLLRDDTY